MFKLGDRVAAGADRHELRVAKLIHKAHAARMELEVAVMPMVDARPRLGIAVAVVESAQLLFQVIRTYLNSDIEIERLGVDTCRHGPMPTLEFPHHDAVEMHDPDCAGDCERAKCAREYEQDAPAIRLGAGHAGSVAVGNRLAWRSCSGRKPKGD